MMNSNLPDGVTVADLPGWHDDRGPHGPCPHTCVHGETPHECEAALLSHIQRFHGAPLKFPLDSPLLKPYVTACGKAECFIGCDEPADKDECQTCYEEWVNEMDEQRAEARLSRLGWDD